MMVVCENCGTIKNIEYVCDYCKSNYCKYCNSGWKGTCQACHPSLIKIENKESKKQNKGNGTKIY